MKNTNAEKLAILKALPVPPPIPGDKPELVLAVCDCEGPHYVGEQKSCRGLNGIGAFGI